MHRTSGIGFALGSVLVALGAIAMTGLTGAGAAGAHAFLVVGLTILVYSMWPERTRCRGRNFGHGIRRQNRSR